MGRRRSGRHGRGRDQGSFTAELAAGLPALMLLLLVGLTAVLAVATRMQCLDAARDGAMAGARGEAAAPAAARVAPAGADITVSTGPDSVTVEVRARIRVLGARLPMVTVTSAATAAREPEIVV
nr:TadE family type IV pilus minor pilin [Mangrovihabitans endophyticus]